jgi:serine/threonine-protein kinase
MSGPDTATVAEMFAGLYEVERPMPWNGLALTYAARKRGRPVVLALLPIDAEQSPEAAAVFEARAKAIVGLEHPRLLSVTGHGVRYGVPFLELEHVDAPTLDRVVAHGPLSRERALTIARRILRALELLEAVSLLHLDLTPSNILVAGEDDVRVMGTGIASTLREVKDDDKTGPTGKGSGPSPGRYLAPEILVGDRVDARTDVYSVGALLHLMLTGHPLGKGGPPPPDDLAPIIRKATERTREQRYPRAAVMRAAIEATGAPLTVAPPPLSPAEADRVLRDLEPVALGENPSALPRPGKLPGAVEGASTDLARATEPVPKPARLPSTPPLAPAPGRSTSRALVWALGGFVVAVVVGAVVVVLGLGGRDEATPTASASAEPARGAAEARAPAIEPEEDPDPVIEPAPRLEDLAMEVDLLAGPLPEPLASLAPRVASGEELSTRERHLVDRYGSANRGDARPQLLIARDFVARGWNSDAISTYVEAYARDPECRRDARMLRDLVELSTHDSSGPLAARTIARIYGTDALPAVRARLAGELSEAKRQRLERLEARLVSP